MFSSTSEITIARPIDDVFNYISHLENDSLWCPEVKSATPLDVSPPGVGKKYDLVARPIPMDQYGGYEIVEFEPPTHMKIQLWQDTSKGETWYRLEETDAGTRLIYKTEVNVGGIGKWFEPMIGWMTTRSRGPRMLRNLKKILESETQGSKA